MSTLFQLESVSFSYDRQRVVDNVSLSIGPGRFYGVIGPNGSGKTTLADLLVRHRRPASGEVLFRGKPLSAYSRKTLAREMALVPQNFYIRFPFTVREVVFMGRYPHMPRFAAPSAEDVRVVEAVMEKAEIGPFAERFITELSGGERQRVIFARALAQDTPVLILDEATSNLDIRHALALLKLCKEKVDREGQTVLGIMQDINLAAAYCDELIFLYKGQLVAHGPTPRTLTPEIIQRVFGVEAKVYFDDWAETRRVVFRN